MRFLRPFFAPSSYVGPGRRATDPPGKLPLHTRYPRQGTRIASGTPCTKKHASGSRNRRSFGRTRKSRFVEYRSRWNNKRRGATERSAEIETALRRNRSRATGILDRERERERIEFYSSNTFGLGNNILFFGAQRGILRWCRTSLFFLLSIVVKIEKTKGLGEILELKDRGW